MVPLEELIPIFLTKLTILIDRPLVGLLSLTERPEIISWADENPTCETVTATPVEQLLVVENSPATTSTHAPIQKLPRLGNGIDAAMLSAEGAPAARLGTISVPISKSNVEMKELVER